MADYSTKLVPATPIVLPIILNDLASTSQTVLTTETEADTNKQPASKQEMVQDPWGVELRCQFCGSAESPVLEISRIWQYVAAVGLCLVCFPLAIIPLNDDWCTREIFRCPQCRKVRRKYINCC